MRISKWLAFCVIVVVSVQPARGLAEDHSRDDPAQNVQRAEEYASEAFEAYSQQDFPRAVSLYRLALAASASPDIIYNLARIYDVKLKDRALAIEFYQRYTADPGADPERARIAVERLAKLRELDRINADSKREQRAAENAQAGGRIEAAAPAERAHKSSSGLSGLQVASIVVGAVGIAGVGVGVGFGIQAKSKADVSHESCNGNLCTSARGVEAARDASNLATISTVGFIAGGALVAAGVTMLIIGSTGSDEREPTAQLVPYADRDGGGARWVGRW